MRGLVGVCIVFILAVLGSVGVFLPWIQMKGHSMLGVDVDGIICLVVLGPVFILALIGLVTKGLARGSAIGIMIFGAVSTAIVAYDLHNIHDTLSDLRIIGDLGLTDVVGDGMWLTLGSSAMLVVVGLMTRGPTKAPGPVTAQ